MLRRTPVALAAVAASSALLALAGCGADTEGADGGPSADQQVRTIVARFGIATREKDYQEICDRLLADDLLQKIEAVGLPCESALQRGLGDVRDPTLAISQVSINGARALVSIHTAAAGQAPSDDALELVRQDGEWRIASLTSPSGTQTQPQTTSTATTTTATTTTATTPSRTTKATKKKK